MRYMVEQLVPSYQALLPGTGHLGIFPVRTRFWKYNYNDSRKNVVKPISVIRPQILPTALNGGESKGLRVFVISDLHTDYAENMSWVRSLSHKRDDNDVLIVAGDVAETLKNFILTMSLLKERFQHVFFVPGNHDLWLRRENNAYANSMVKLDKLLDVCQSLGVETKPLVIDGLGIIPIFSWYHESFDTEDDITDIRVPPLEMACKDYHACKWSGELKDGHDSVAIHFDAMNEKHSDIIKEIQLRCNQILTFSHFVPRQELCPEKRMLFYPNLPKVVGSDFLEARIRSLHGNDGRPSACHVFGHTHFCWDALVDGIRYVQAPLAYPREQKRRMNGGEGWLPFCIFCDGEFTARLSPCFWSDYYAVNTRTPQNTTLAPWVAKFYRKFV
ncbi:hypothetical protein LIER_16549 [Lithospermum erythrorhizon]|uniref:Calcineurin-like phosphoesterase domain-containing protein n=1 Tax=Lithospermum erythrorhizon TaxID=34254 RepID=A0AAV3Q9K9_LITER